MNPCVNATETLPVTEQALRRETNRDSLLAQVAHIVESGWTSMESHPDIAPYASRTHELTTTPWDSNVG